MRAFTRSSLGGGTLCAGLIAMAAIFLTPRGSIDAQGTNAQGFIVGVVQGPSGPEAGVWVIAETKDLPTNFIKIVVTDEQGRFALPELPSASYAVGARLRSGRLKPVSLKPGAAQVTLRAAAATAAQEAAKVIRQLLALPPRAAGEVDVPRYGCEGQRRREACDAEPLDQLAQVDCSFCHQLGNTIRGRSTT
jgi:methylaspartate ammonia-lyase